MLTRIEIDGFKSFHNFAVDLPQFAVLLGPNAVGKSNFLDAIRLLSRLVRYDVVEAFQGLRGDPHELFRQRGDGIRVDRMRFTVQFDPAPQVGRAIRYTVVIERRPTDVPSAGLAIEMESVAFAPFGDSDNTILGASSETGFAMHVGGDLGRQLDPIEREMRNWRVLQPEPTMMRRALPELGPDTLDERGENLARVLRRIQVTTRTATEPQGALADISADLATMIPGLLGVEVQEDPRRQSLDLVVRSRDLPDESVRMVSDGTLRVLAMLTAVGDPDAKGLVCFEEPENGLHPRQLRELVRHFAAAARDDLQVVVASHSPVVARTAPRESVVLFERVAVREPGVDGFSHVTRARTAPRRGEHVGPGTHLTDADLSLYQVAEG